MTTTNVTTYTIDSIIASSLYGWRPGPINIRTGWLTLDDEPCVLPPFCDSEEAAQDAVEQLALMLGIEPNSLDVIFTCNQGLWGAPRPPFHAILNDTHANSVLGRGYSDRLLSEAVCLAIVDSIMEDDYDGDSF